MNPLNQNQPQNPKEQALNLLKQQGITVPQGMENNPQAIIQHLMQSGRVPQGRVQQIMQRMFRR
jgi:RIO-like serine/threonine protein kinase